MVGSSEMIQGTIGCTPNSVPMVFIVFSRDSCGIIIHKYPLCRAYIRISHRGTLVGVHPSIHPKMFTVNSMAALCMGKVDMGHPKLEIEVQPDPRHRRHIGIFGLAHLRLALFP